MDVYLVQPRGFCAGVRRALDLVDQALNQFGAPIYVRHEIVHNKHVIEDLEKQGVIFIDELDEIEDKTRPVIFSAHGVSEQIKQQAKKMNLTVIDAICPLVEAVHKQIKNLEQQEAEIIVIGKKTHPEILGTIGQLQNPQKAHVILNVKEALTLNLDPNSKIGIITQTTLSEEDTQEITTVLHRKYVNLKNWEHPNICFATTNRQRAVRELLNKTSNIIIIGSKNSSNSTHLKEVALKHGAKNAWLIDDVSEIDWQELNECTSIGISAGASAPEYLVEELLRTLQKHYNNINIHQVIITQESISFK